MWNPSQDVDEYGAVAELVVTVPKGQLMEAAECQVGRYIKHRLNCIIGIAKAQVRIWVQMWGRFQVWPEKVL